MRVIPEKITEAVAYIKSRYSTPSEIGIVLGSGLGNFVSEMNVEKEIPYTEIPHFPVSTVEGHSGRLIFGQIGHKHIVVMAGRLHFYEGHAATEVAFPIRVMKLLGVHTLLLSNAAGGVNAAFAVGDLMIITDHISLATVNPLIGKNEDAFGPRFPDMSEPYAKTLIRKGKAIAGQLDIPVKEGVYFGVTGPTFETRAEYKMILALGGDAVGMSTVQEVIVAAHAGIQVFGISVITDLGIREEDNIITHEEVLEAASAAEPKLTALFKALVKAI
ncbi:purine-nucleoside phosphorylase [Agriterribacter sp.]|uniref:purine-nucleoside phosphorylase n=1 Tax=Agriterribacter sp. TaxID=2821509 RepID=UPI002B9DFE9C|nr:purine-nucleoside phosphorylase [Agriterribacter sp.]HTN06876.1 purine-nucleoside phosphorylase [Agriterribacter sp.]